MKRIRTTRSSDSAVLQDLQYWYDPVGNITLQKDLAHQPVYFNGSVADAQNNYVYDALYRLIQAQGRELAGDNSAPTYNDSSRSGITPVPIASTDTAKMRRYMQYYDYDAVGNFVQMRHTVTGGTGNWTRYYTTNAANNRLQQTVVGSGTPENYGYNTRGNITSGFSHLQSLTYNADNRLEKIVIDSNRTAYYQYDSSGQRVRKTVVNTSANTTDSRKYVGEWELYHKFTTSSLTTIVKRETLHISDDTGRIALIDTRTSGTGIEPIQLLRYQYSNHLQSASLELDASGAIISYEEYYPYGSTSFQSGRSSIEVSLKRYRYTGKERDEESGLYYHGARYYIPWLCRWLSSDPINNENYNLQRGYGFGKNKRRQFLELVASPYEYCYDNPVRFTDPSGEQVPPESTETLQSAETGVIDEVIIQGQVDKGPGVYHYKMTMNEQGGADLELKSFRNKNHHSWLWGLIQFDTKIDAKRYIVDFDFLGEGNKRYYIGFPQNGKGYANAWKGEQFENDYLRGSGNAIDFVFNYADENHSVAASDANTIINSQNFGMETSIPMAPLSKLERDILAQSKKVLNSNKFEIIRQAHKSGMSAEVNIDGRTIIYEPDFTYGQAMTLHGENGFLLGPGAFTSEGGVVHTVLWETTRLNTQGTGSLGVNQTAGYTETAQQTADKLLPYLKKK